jgi:hypothetical protein
VCCETGADSFIPSPDTDAIRESFDTPPRNRIYHVGIFTNLLTHHSRRSRLDEGCVRRHMRRAVLEPSNGRRVAAEHLDELCGHASGDDDLANESRNQTQVRRNQTQVGRNQTQSDAIRRNQTQSDAIPPLAQHDTLWCMCSPAIGAIIFHTTVAIDGAWITK